MAVLLLCGLLASAGARAELDPRLTGETVAAQLDGAQRGIAERAAQSPQAGLAPVAAALTSLIADLRRELGNDVSRPLVKLGDEQQGVALRAYAAASQAQGWLGATAQCQAYEVAGTALALKSALTQLASTLPSGANDPPAIWTVENAEHRAIFGVRSQATAVALGLGGARLFDAKCGDPLVTLAAEDGHVLPGQPTLTSALPDRVELKLPDALAAGTYRLTLRTQRKGRLFGCAAGPEASAAIQVLSPATVTIDYSLEQACNGARKAKGAGADTASKSAVTGSLPELKIGGATVSRKIDVAACSDVSGYALSATAKYSGGETRTVGPISQSASAGIAAGLPGGLTVTWDPSARTLFVKSAASACPGIY